MTLQFSAEGEDGAVQALDDQIEVLTGSLTVKQRAFIHHYLRHRNVTGAYRHAYDVSKSSYNTYRRNAHALIKSPVMQEIIALHGRRTMLATRITQEEIVSKWWTIANTPITEVVRLHVPPCRYCHGINHAFQWTTEREFREAHDRAVVELCVGLTAGDIADMATAISEGKTIDPRLPNCDGGFGFDVRGVPKAECPECRGRGGPPILEITDTDLLSPEARLIIQGIKKTPHGIEVVFADRIKALENIARYLGMFAGRLADEIPNPLEQLARRLMSQSSTVPVVLDEDLQLAPNYLNAIQDGSEIEDLHFSRDDGENGDYPEP